MATPAPLIVCGPSGVGKSVLIKKLQETFPNKFGFSVSHTTRGPRPGEENGKDYHFSDLDTMERGVAEGLFIESARVHGNMYGTSKAAVEAVRNAGKVCILDIDVQGAKSIHEQQAWPDTRFIFIKPPSLAELERRLRGRGTETEEKVLKRLGNARGEIEFSERVQFFDHKFVLDGMVGATVPVEVMELLQLFSGWYPSLGPLPPILRVLRQFQAADKSGSGRLPRARVKYVLSQCGNFSEAELDQLVDPAADEGQDTVDFHKFLQLLFKGGPVQ